MRSLFVQAVILGTLATVAGGVSFESDVQPVLRQTCQTCHNDKLASGGLIIAPFLDPKSLAADRAGWERIVAKLRAGEMPPSGVPKPPAAQINALLSYVKAEFDRVDKATPIDPGRVTAGRLNRSEYTNTVRDLLGVDFEATNEFPADDSSYGFDNIADVLTVSPTLMQKYLQAAETIASRAVGGDPLPKAGLFNLRPQIRRIDPNTIEARNTFEYDADYVVRAQLIGHRGAKDKPVTLVISVDGKPFKTVEVPVQISAVNQQGGATQRSSQEVRVFLAAGQHLVRTEFVNDDGLKDIPEKERMNNGRNIYPDTIEVAGPFPPANPTPRASRSKALVCDPVSGPSCVDRILSTVARRAYRRPATKDELAALKKVFDRARAAEYTPAQSLQFSLEAILVSPQFLFRIEHDPKPGTSARITDLELASRVSYFLWSSMPDDELLQLAESNKLRDPAVLDTQVKRMIGDPKSLAFAANFAGQWLEVRSLDAIKPDTRKFPEWKPELKEAMRTETTLFFQSVLRDDRPISDFLDGKYTYLNETLAKHYGIAGVAGPEFRRVDLTGNQRGGVLTQGSVLTVSSYPSRTSVVLRGKYVLENILGAPPPPPPPDVPRLDEDTVGVAKSLREQMEKHRSDAVCASCHSRMDVLGFGLENYDAIGRWRTMDGKFLIDSSGAFPDGKTFSDPAGMKALLRDEMPEFARCLTEKLLTYSLGRGLEAFDRRTIEDLVRQAAGNDYRFQSLVLGIVRSVPFQQRRGDLKQEASSK